MTPRACGPTGRRCVSFNIGRNGAAAAVLALAVACTQPSARPYAGSWERRIDSAGVATLVIKPTGAFEIRTPHPATPAAGLMKGPAFFHADTVTFRGASCERGEARYQLTRRDSLLTILALGSDGCGLRRSTLSGDWVRR